MKLELMEYVRTLKTFDSHEHLIPESERLTLCVSTQVGCGMGCTFFKYGKPLENGNIR